MLLHRYPIAVRYRIVITWIQPAGDRYACLSSSNLESAMATTIHFAASRSALLATKSSPFLVVTGAVSPLPESPNWHEAGYCILGFFVIDPSGEIP